MIESEKGHAGSGDEAFKEFQKKAEGTNINPRTLLATDYLNHFNEIVMLIEMVPDMPDILEEAKEWQPKSYQDHFRDSTFSDKDLAVEAYEHVPPKYRKKFEHTVRQMDEVVLAGIAQAEETLALGDPELLRIRMKDLVGLLHQLGEVAGGIIHGSEVTMDQSEVDAVMGGAEDVSGKAAVERAGLQDQLDNLMAWATAENDLDTEGEVEVTRDPGNLAELEDRLRVDLEEVKEIADRESMDLDDVPDAPQPKPAPSSQSDIDALFDTPPSTEGGEESSQETKKKDGDGPISQSDIDSLFD